MKFFIFLSLFLVLVYVGMGRKKNPDFNRQKPHHRQDGFANRYGGRLKKLNVIKWQWERFYHQRPQPPSHPIKGIDPNLPLIYGDGNNVQVTWIGHATVLFQIDGVNILTDPHWGKRASPFSFIGPKRHQAPGIALDFLPPIHVVLISHNHWDHLDKATVQHLMNHHPKVQFFVPLGVQYWFLKNIKGSRIGGKNPNVIALDWDDHHLFKGKNHSIELHFLSVQHWSARHLWDRYETLWGSWAMIHPHFKCWFSGDLGYSADTVDIGKKMKGFDLAAIAIGAYEPRWFMKNSHINPKEAIQVMKDVKAKAALAIHWGTFENLSDEPLDAPPIDLKKALDLEPTSLDFRVLKHGQTWVLPLCKKVT
jgi:L-ascorbate metabolism protein UlaG (beta-lactamase superfamily)